MHAAEDFAGMATFTGAVFGDDAWLGEVHFVGDAFDERFGAGDDGGDLEGSLVKSLKEDGAHEK